MAPVSCFESLVGQMKRLSYTRGSTMSRRNSISVKCFHELTGSPAGAPLFFFDSHNFLQNVFLRLRHRLEMAAVSPANIEEYGS